VHIQDFNYPRDDFKVWCNKHIDQAEPGAVIFTATKIWFEDEIITVGWQCAIKGPAVGGMGHDGNCPNVGADFEERVKEKL
jgi:hypothetical protein